MKYDLTFIGAGPSTIFALLKLIKKEYKGKTLIIEKGKSTKIRKKNEVISGWAGAGCWSDSKLSSALDVGGTIPGLTQQSLDKFDIQMLETLNRFKQETHNKEILNWNITNGYDTKDSTLEWNTHKTCHIGTECGRAIYEKMEDFISSQPNIEIKFETEVLDIDGSEYDYKLSLQDNSIIETERVILATGQKNVLPSKVIEKFKLRSKPRAFQLGIRVEDIINSQYENIIKSNYDFKFVKEYIYGDVKVRVRTFCCNSGNAHTCAEKAVEGFTCFNGHAFKELDPNNKTVNYGIMCEIEGLNQYETKEDQIDLMKRINSIEGWKDDNFGNNTVNPLPRRKLLEGFPQLENYYPKEAILSLQDFIISLSKLVDLSQAKYLYPETKLSGKTPTLNYKTFETTSKGLYMIGDCACSRGISKSSYTGYRFAKSFLKGE